MKVRGYASYLIAAMLVVVAARYGLSKALGAHPFWSVSIVWVGVPVGLLLSLFAARSGFRWPTRIGAFALLLCVAAVAAHYGKLRFVASFAEDRLAGKFWYYGWIGIACFTAAFLSAVLTPIARRSN